MIRRGFEIPFSMQTGESAVLQNSRETLINMFVEPQTSGRRSTIRRQRRSVDQYRAFPGVKRCLEKNGTTYYAVIGNKFYTMVGTALTERGTLDTSVTRCTMVFDDNGDVAISDGTKLYHWDGATLTKPATESTVGPLTFLGGRAVYSEPGTGRFWWSGPNDLQSWEGLDFATAEGKPDNLVRVYENLKELWLFGVETTEIWTLSGSADTAFAPYTVMERGCGAALSVVSEDNSLIWLGDDGIIYRADGYRPMRISSHSIERKIAALSKDVRATCEAFAYTDEGHKFITFRWPGHLTLQLNLATGLWNEARTFGLPDWDMLGSQFTNCDLYLTTWGIASLARGINTDAGDVFERVAISAPITEGARRVNLRKFFLDCEVGRAAIDQPDPQVMLRLAPDGETFGNERARSLGKIGEYTRRATWRNLGMGRRHTLMVSCTDDVEFSILGADVDGEIVNG